jgi:ferredoxin
MRVMVDLDLCEGHGQCCEQAPDVFASDDDDVMHIVSPDISDDQRPRVEAAVLGCPRQALRLTDD